MGLLFSRSHLHGENNSPHALQSALHTDRVQILKWKIMHAVNIISYYFTQTVNMNRVETCEHSKLWDINKLRPGSLTFHLKSFDKGFVFGQTVGSISLQIKACSLICNVHCQTYGNEKDYKRKKLNLHLTLKISNYNRSLELLWFKL